MSVVAAMVCCTPDPGGRLSWTSSRRSSSEPKRLIGMTVSSPRLATVTAPADARVAIRWPSAHRRMRRYSRWSDVSSSGRSPSSPAASGRSPGRTSSAQSTGTAVSATSSDASSAKVTVSAKGRKKAPTSPPMKASGMKTTTVVSVEAKMAGVTSAVASSAARQRSLPAWMWR